MTIRIGCVGILAAVALAACGGGGSDPQPVSDIQVSISPTSATVAAGGHVQFNATVTGDTSDGSVSWSATAGTIDADGLFSAPTTSGAVQVTATSRADRTRSASASVTVLRFAITPGSATAHAGGSAVAFSATLDAAPHDATWRVSPAVGALSAANGTSVSYVPPATLASNTVVTLTATEGEFVATATITVTPPVTLEVSPTVANVTAGAGQVLLSATLSNSTDTISWSLNPAVGGLSATSGGSVAYVPPASVSSQTQVVVTARAGGLEASATVTVNPAPSLSVTPATASVSAGGAGATFNAILENATDTISWTLSPSVGTLSASTGTAVTYTPPSDLASTTVVTLTASAAGKTSAVQITVNPPPKVVNVPYDARNGLTVTLTSLTRVDSGSYYTYTAAYTQTNNTAGRIDEGQLKLYFTNRDAMPQYGFFGALMPGQSLSRSYSFQVLYSETPWILEFDGDNFFSSSPIPGSLQWVVADVLTP